MHHMYAIIFLLSTLHLAWLFEYQDLADMAVFPPKVVDTPGEPRGHKKPFGWQRDPEGPIKEYTEALKAADFFKYHANPLIPLVLRGYLKESPAIKNWASDEYLTKQYGDLNVLVEHKLEDRSSTSGRMKLSDFLKNYKNNDLYVVSMFPSEMHHEVRAIPTILCGTFKDYAHESNLWISSGGTRSVVHYDADHNFHCMLAGRKDFMMVNNNITTKANLYYKKKNPGVGSGFSFLDPDSIDMNKFKRIAHVPWTYATLYPGDCIFIPAQYIHQVRGYDRTLAVTSLFTADVEGNFDGTGCTDEIMTKWHTMADIHFQWTYKKGDKTIDMGYMNVELVKSQILEYLQETKDKKFTKMKFIKAAGRFGPLGRNKTKIAKIWEDVFKFSDDFVFTIETMDTLTLEQWKVFCRAVEPPHGVVTDGSEPVFVKPGERHQWEMEHPEEDDGQYMTETEKIHAKAADGDPNLQYLSEEEKKEYKKKKKSRKVNKDDDDDDDSSSWTGEVLNTISDMPDEYQAELRRGIIPNEFKETFMESLSDVVKERFAPYFKENMIPKELLTQMMVDVRSLTENGGNDGNDENDDDDYVHQYKFPYRFSDISLKRQKMLVAGKIPAKDIPLFVKALPDHTATLQKGILPRELLMDLIESNEEDFDDQISEFQEFVREEEEKAKSKKKKKKKKTKQKDEL